MVIHSTFNSTDGNHSETLLADDAGNARDVEVARGETGEISCTARFLGVDLTEVDEET